MRESPLVTSQHFPLKNRILHYLSPWRARLVPILLLYSAALVTFALLFRHGGRSDLSATQEQHVRLRNLGAYHPGPTTTPPNRPGQISGSSELSRWDIEARLDEMMLKPAFSNGLFPGGRLPPPTMYDTNKIMFCGIPKNSNSQFRAVLCRTVSNVDGKKFVKNPYRVHYDKFCSQGEVKIPNDPTSNITEHMWRDKSYHKLAIVRDPIDRFISGFIDKCIRLHKPCYKCSNETASCFADHNLATMQRLASSKRVPNMPTHHINHFLPQFWFCDFQSHLRHYTLLYYSKTDQFRELARRLLLKWGVPDSLIRRGWGNHMQMPFLEVKTKHSSNPELVYSVQSEILSNLTLLNQIFSAYAIDYHYFKFPLPVQAAKLCDAEPDSVQNYDICFALKYKKLPIYAS